MSDQVRFPQMRELMVLAIRALADPAFQRRVWIGHELTIGDDPWHHDFDQVVHTLLDDLSLADGPPHSCIDVVTRNLDEIGAVNRVAALLADLLRVRGVKLTDADYPASPERPALVASARAALSALGEQ